jgi:ribosomal protein S18 acetylase RimI-like enzyme
VVSDDGPITIPTATATAIEGLRNPIPPDELAALVALDAEITGELGDVFAAGPWSAEQFGVDLPGKWEFSRVARHTASRAVVGYWVASIRGPGHLHTHRVGVRQSVRRSGIARALHDSVIAAARARGLVRMTLLVAEANGAARRSYATLGFVPVVGERLREFVPSGPGGWRPEVGDERLTDRGRRHLVLEKNLEGDDRT